MTDTLPPLPPGFTLEPPRAPSPPAPPAPPPGFVLDTQRVDPFNETPMPPAPTAAPQQPNGILDVAQALPSGMVRGAVETAMLPVTAGRLADSGASWLFDQGDNLIRSIIGAPQLTEADYAERAKFRNGEPVTAALSGGQDMVRTIMDNTLYDPQTTAGDYAETVGEFLAPGGLPSKATRMAPTVAGKAAGYGMDIMGNAVLPAVASETAGQLTEGTSWEPVARTAGAVLGGGATAWGRAANAPESVLRRALPNSDGIDWARAVGLQDNSTGIRLTGPEAIAQATDGGASAVADVMRVVEGSIEGNAKLGPFFAQRPAQVSTAVGGLLDNIAPQSAQPSSLGPRVSNAAGEVLDGVRQDINTSTRPLYKAAEPQPLPQAEFDALAADPRFASALARLRASELGPDYAALPDNSVGIVDAVTKDMFARGEALSNAANPLYGPELGAANTAGAATARNTASVNSAEYAQALAEQAAARQGTLAPLENGPLGQAAAANTTQSVGEAILPRNPLVGSEGEISDAVTRLVMQDADATGGLVRQNLADRFNAASTDTQQGANQFSGARFAKDISGNSQRDATLTAVLDALGATNASAQLPELLDVLQATGRRKPIGSATEFNRTINSELGNASPAAQGVDFVKSLGTSFLGGIGDATKRAALRHSTATLADMFADPQSVQLIQQALLKSPTISLGEMLARVAAQTAPILTGSEQ